MGNFGGLPGGIGKVFSEHPAWTSSQVEQLLRLRDVENLSMPDVADQIGRTVEECNYRYKLVKDSHRLQDEIRARNPRRPNYTALPSALSDRDARIDARCRREAEAARTGVVTSIFFDDPLPGCSALDKRMARV